MANESAGGEPLRCFFALMSWKLARILASFGDFGEEDKNDYTETTKSENKICSVFFSLSMRVFIDFARKFLYNLH